MRFKVTILYFLFFSAVYQAVANDATPIFRLDYRLVDDTTSFESNVLPKAFAEPSSEIQADTTKISKEPHDFPLKDPVYKDAKDSLLYSIDGKKVFLWGQAVVKYQNMTLKAAYIEYDMENNMVFAEGRPDSTGLVVGRPIFTEGGQTYTMDKIFYNFDSKKAKISNVITEEAGGVLHSRDTKLMPDNAINVSGGKYTTCELEDPHFYIAISKAKVIPGNKLVTGPAYLVIADVPFPLVLPFGFFPNKQGRASGIILPRYGEEFNRGFFLQNGGVYLGLSDYFDLRLTGNVYSKGSWASTVQTGYRKRYRFSGGFAFSYSNNIFGEKGFDDYTKDKSYSITWQHRQDPKANPNSTFSSSLNLGSPNYNRYNAENINNFLTNTISSSVAYSKVWADTPFSMSVSMNHSQNNLDSTIYIGFPRASLNMNRVYPFKRKNNLGRPAWYEKIGLSYTGNLENSINTRTDSLLNLNSLSKMRNGVQHKIPISTSFNLLKYITVSPSASYAENWYLETTRKRWDPDEERVVNDNVRGFKRAWQYNASLGMSTKLYGMYSFKSTSKVQAIRHVMTPSLSLGYSPDFAKSKYGFFKELVTPYDTIQYSIFDGTIYGGPGRGENGSLSYSLNNNLEMKILSPKDTITGIQKIKLLESFGFSGSYNILADSLKLSPISIRAHTTLFEKFNVNVSGSLDPYAEDAMGRRQNQLQYKMGKFPVRLTRASAGISFSLQGGKRKTSDRGTAPTPPGRGAGGFSQMNSAMSQMGGAGFGLMGAMGTTSAGLGDPSHPMGNEDIGNIIDNIEDGMLFGESLGAEFEDEYVDFDIPWNLRFSYSLAYSKRANNSSITQSMSVSGSISLTPNWKVGFSSGFDFKNRKLTTTSININRDLHCWEMGIAIVPIGYLKSYSFRINVKSGTLRDLKYTKAQSRYDY